MDAVRYSSAAADSCTEIMLSASYPESNPSYRHLLERDAIRDEWKFDSRLTEHVVFDENLRN